MAIVFWKGSTVSTSPTVAKPAPMEARRPPPLMIAMVMPSSVDPREHGIG